MNPLATFSIPVFTAHEASIVSKVIDLLDAHRMRLPEVKLLNPVPLPVDEQTQPETASVRAERRAAETAPDKPASAKKGFSRNNPSSMEQGYEPVPLENDTAPDRLHKSAPAVKVFGYDELVAKQKALFAKGAIKAEVARDIWKKHGASPSVTPTPEVCALIAADIDKLVA